MAPQCMPSLVPLSTVVKVKVKTIAPTSVWGLGGAGKLLEWGSFPSFPAVLDINSVWGVPMGLLRDRGWLGVWLFLTCHHAILVL